MLLSKLQFSRAERPRAPRLKCEIVQTQGTRLNKISLARGQRPWGPGSWSASREIATLRVARASATQGGARNFVGARCFLRWRRPVVGRSQLSFGQISFVELVATHRVAGLSASGGVGARPNFRCGQLSRERRGLAKGAAAPLDALFAYFLSHHRK